jgi:hypothetical protein
MLVDLSELDLSQVKAGDYLMTVVYGFHHAQSITSRPVAVRLRQPDAREQAELDSLKAELAAQYHHWGEWTLLQRPKNPAELKVKIDPRDPLRFNRAWRYLFYGPDQPAQVDPAILDGLRGVYQPDAALFRLQLLKARRSDADYRRLLAECRKRYPGLSTELDDIDSGRSWLLWERARSK